MNIKHSRRDKIFVLSPGEFVDNTRYMEHSSMKSRYELFELLTTNLKKLGLWDKVHYIKDIMKLFNN